MEKLKIESKSLGCVGAVILLWLGWWGFVIWAIYKIVTWLVSK